MGKRNDSALDSVTCEVKSCKYHAPGGACRAANIVVEAPEASDKAETYCGTYAPTKSNSSNSLF